MRRLGLDKTGDGTVNEADVRALTQADAVTIFVEHYFTRPKIDKLPETLQANVFDMYVNSGANAVKILQQLLVDMGHQISVDGGIGPQTIAAAVAASNRASGFLSDAYAIARRNYYFRLADSRRASRKYARTRNGGKGGWITRAEEFMSPKYHMSAKAFQQRIASWG
jgi:lysozyme family protein